ncbi:MAG: translesion DNA synthesis-associated protein ImuA [Steroidobacteraceae bacterium]
MSAVTPLFATVRPLPPPERSAVLEQLAEHCRFSRSDGSHRTHQSTGHATLDERLPGGGWPLGALIEVMSAQSGIGELSLLLPTLCALAREGRQIACIAPPWLPNPPALAQQGLPLSQLLLIQPAQPQDALWAMEQCLRCDAFGAVLGWCPDIDARSVRRLQLAAEAGGGSGWLYRPLQALEQSSPAALRLRLQATPAGLEVQLRKVRGGAPGAVVVHPAAAA